VLSQRFVPARVSFLLDEPSAEIFLGGQRVVRSATQRQICSDILATMRERLQMMELEVAGLAASLAALVRERAAPLVALEHLASFRYRHVSAALARHRPPRIRRFVRIF
jgi:hypothetical protein